MDESRNSFRSIQEVPIPFRRVFLEYPCFNIVQSKVFNDVLHSDQSLVISSPTGSGKTAIFELAIVKLLMQFENQNDGEKLFKIVYISPIKSLCQERLVDWQKKFSPFGLKTISVTGDSDAIDFHTLANYNLILSTPEKWDSLTRRWRDNEKLVEVVKLFMIDEVHLLNEENRGSTLEVIVSRMKTIENSLLVGNSGERQRIRFLALSATIPNVRDIAEWLGEPPNVKFFQFSEDVRPVKLKKIVLGYNYDSKTMTPFKFDLSLTYKLHFLMIQHSEGKPTLIFCSTRKSVEMTAKYLIQSLNICLNPAQSQRLHDIANMISDVKVKETVKHGIGYHHAGSCGQEFRPETICREFFGSSLPTYMMLSGSRSLSRIPGCPIMFSVIYLSGLIPETRHAIEEAFRRGELPVLVTTSTLAMGVNLPAHLVIIKSTKCYGNCGFRDYTEVAIHQMIGRAGRPQFDTSATVLILTTNDDREKFEKMVGCKHSIESNLHRHLTEHLNAEVVLRTITDLDVAMQWLASTFLYVRARKNPRHYGLPITLTKHQNDKKLLEMCQIDLNKLISAGMVTMNQNIIITPTKTGELMAKYYVAFETMKLFTQLTGSEILIQILALISKCHEFSDLCLRVNDKKTLNLLNKNSTKDTIRFPLNGRIKSSDMKVNCIIQAILGNLDISDHSIISDSFTIMRSGSRIVKCLIDYLATRGKYFYSALLNSIILGKCFQAKLWENSVFVSKQLSGIGSVSSTQLVNSGKTTFDKILESNPRDIEMIIKKRPPMGDYLIEEVQHIPRYIMSLEKVCENNSIEITLTIQLMNLDYLREKSTVNINSAMTLLVGNNLNEILIYERYKHSYMMEHPQLVKTVQTAITPDLEKIEAHFISEDWVGIDCNSDILFPMTNKKSKTNLEKSTKKQESKLPSYIQMFLDMYMKTKKKPTKENSTKKAERKSDEKKNEVKAINVQPKNVYSEQTAKATEDGIITSTVQKLADKNIGFHFMANDADLLGSCLQNGKKGTADDNKLSEKVRTTEKIEQDSKNKDLKEYNYDNDQMGKEADKSINKYGLRTDISEICEFSNELVDDFFGCADDVDYEFFGADEEDNSDRSNTLHNAKNPECFVNELDSENTINCHDEIGNVQDEKTKLSFNFLEENRCSISLDGQKYLQKDNQNIDHSRLKNECDDINICPGDVNVHSRSNIPDLFGSQKDQMVNQFLELSDVESINEELTQNGKRECESRESKSNPKISFNSQIQRSKICKNLNSDRESIQTNPEFTEIQSEKTKLFVDFDSVLKNDASLLSIRQKYAYGENIQENNKFIKASSQTNLNNSQKNMNIHWFSKTNKKRKRGLDDIHPAELLEDKIFREEKKIILDKFKKPDRKKINHYPETDLYPDSTISNQKYIVTEVLEPTKKPNLYDLKADIARERMGIEKENQKSIKWRSPLVMSPAVKFSPKMNFSGQLFKETDIGAQTNIFNETVNTSMSSKNSRNAPNSTLSIQKTPKQPKNIQNIFQNYKHRGTKFPLCDNEYHEENSKSKEVDRSLDYSDICSASILEGLRIKEQKKNTPKRYKQCEPSSATDYYTQFVNQTIAQKEKSDEKIGSFERKSPSPSNSEKENIPKEDISPSRNSSLSQIIRSQKNFTLSQDMLESQNVRKYLANGFVDSREMHNSVLSQNRPLAYDQNSSHQINSLNKYEGQIMHPTQGGCIYNNSSLIQPSIAPEYSVNTSVYPLQDPRCLAAYGSPKLSRPTDTMISGHMPEMICNTQNMNVHYPRLYPKLEYHRSLTDNFGPNPNHFPYSPIGLPENYRYPPWPGMPCYYNPEVCVKQDYRYPDYHPNSQDPDSYMKRQISDFDDIQNMRFTNNSQVERDRQRLEYQENSFRRKSSFEDFDKISNEIKTHSQMKEDAFTAMNVSKRVPLVENPVIISQENQEMTRRNNMSYDLNKSFMRNSFNDPPVERYMPNISYPPSGLPHPQNFGFPNRYQFDYFGNSNQSQSYMPRSGNYQQFHAPNDKEYVMNKFLYSLSQ